MNIKTIAFPLRRWQAEAIPLALECILQQLNGQTGPKVISACTGAGKSITIAVIIATRARHLIEDEVIVVTTPTQRLVRQLSATIGQHVPEPVAQHYAGAKWRAGRIIVCCNASARSLSALLEQTGRRIGLWIADECHRTETPEIHAFHKATPAAAAIGFTATPFRAKHDERLQLWDDELYRYSPTMALADGCLVPWRAVTWTGEAQTELDEACLQMMAAHKHIGPGVVNAKGILDAEDFAETMTTRGIKAAAIHSKIPGPRQDALLEQLRTGALDALVYPSLLSEGVDLPWLAWGCLRRRVSSSVRFIQELGRFLRTNAGKTEAVILDPLGQLEDKATSLDAVLGWIEDEDLKEPTGPVEDPADDDDEQSDDDDGPKTYARVADALAAYSRSLLLVAIADGVLTSKDGPKATHWRKGATTERQVSLLGRLARHDQYLDPEHRAPIREMLQRKIVPSKGAASDLITLFKALKAHGEAWTPGNRLAVPTVEDFEAQQRARAAEPIHVAAVQRRTDAGLALAFAATQGGYEILRRGHITSRPSGIHPTALALTAIRLAVIEAKRRRPELPVQVCTSDSLAAQLAFAEGYASSRNVDVLGELQRRSLLPSHEVAAISEQSNRAMSAAWSTLAKIAPRRTP